MIKIIKEYLNDSIETKQAILKNENILKKVEEISKLIVNALNNGNKILFIGNGGSASDCDHLATEFVSRFYKDRHAFNAMSLTSNNALITALSNDFGFENVFARQIEALGKKGDILFALSTSGNSKNIIKAIKIANEMEIFTFGMSGKNKCEMDEVCKSLVKIPNSETPVIQECQMTLAHIICKIVEDKLLI